MDRSIDRPEISEAGCGEFGLLNRLVLVSVFDGPSRCPQSFGSLGNSGGFRVDLNLLQMLVVLVAVAGLDLTALP